MFKTVTFLPGLKKQQLSFIPKIGIHVKVGIQIKDPTHFMDAYHQDRLFWYWIARLWFWMLRGFLTLEYWFLNIGLW